MSWGWVVCDPTRGDRQRQGGRTPRPSPAGHGLGAGPGDRPVDVADGAVRRPAAGPPGAAHRTPSGPGDVVLARFPARPDLLVVKRVRRAVPGGHWVEGDNPFVTDDSRAFGAAVVVGRVVARLWPRPGRLPHRPPPRLSALRRVHGRQPGFRARRHADRFADDPAFAVHEGGKLSRDADPVDRLDRRPRAHLHARRRPGVQRHRRRARARPPVHLGPPRGRRRLRRHGRAGPGRHRPGRLPAGHGGQGLPVQASSAGCRRVPIVLSTNDVDTIVETVAAIAPSFGGINLEDISAPRCFEIEARLRERLDIPVMHDDQHGTAIVVLAALRNAAKVVGRRARRPARGRRRGRGRRRRLHEDPARGGRSATSPSPTPRASCTPGART